jgi:hypothetical protein
MKPQLKSNQTIQSAVNELLACYEADINREPYPINQVLEITTDQVKTGQDGTIDSISGFVYLPNGMRVVITLDVDPDELLTPKEYGS